MSSGSTALSVRGKTVSARLLDCEIPGAVIMDPEEVSPLLPPILQPGDADRALSDLVPGTVSLVRSLGAERLSGSKFPHQSTMLGYRNPPKGAWNLPDEMAGS